jgi:sugar lactone lactonase YvrE
MPDGEGVAATSVAVPNPAGLAVDSAGNLFISTQTRIRRISPAGVITTVVGKPAGNACAGTDNGDGGPVDAAKACAPAGLAFDTAGNLYFADTSSQTARVRKVSVNQTITTFAGGQTIGSATNDGQAIHAFLNSLEGLLPTRRATWA